MEYMKNNGDIHLENKRKYIKNKNKYEIEIKY